MIMSELGFYLNQAVAIQLFRVLHPKAAQHQRQFTHKSFRGGDHTRELISSEYFSALCQVRVLIVFCIAGRPNLGWRASPLVF
jgi:hypothetical protein